jgi:hypothetical protein
MNLTTPEKCIQKGSAFQEANRNFPGGYTNSLLRNLFRRRKHSFAHLISRFPGVERDSNREKAYNSSFVIFATISLPRLATRPGLRDYPLRYCFASC